MSDLRGRRSSAARTFFAAMALIAGGAVVSLVARPPSAAVRVALDEVGDRAVVEIEATDGRAVKIAIDTSVGEGRLVVEGVQDRGSVEIEVVDLPARAYVDGVEHRLVAGGPAVRLRSTKVHQESMRLCLPYDRALVAGSRGRFLRVDGAGTARPVVTDLTASSGSAACGNADSTAVFAAGWVLPLDEPSAARNPTDATTTTTTTRPGGSSGVLGSDDLVGIPAVAEEAPAIPVELGSDLPVSGVLLDVTGIGPGARVQRCVTVEVRSSPQPSMTVRPTFEVLSSDAAPLLDNVRLTVEEGTVGTGGCRTFSPARTLLAAEAVSEAGRRYGTYATGLPGWTVAEGTERTYRVTVELPGATPNLPKAVAPARFTLRWELR
jgi:hypothetical protein